MHDYESDYDAGEMGTAVLIGPRLILTARHLVPWGAKFWGGDFVPGYFEGVSTIPPWYYRSYSVTAAVAWSSTASAYDMAVLRLDEPVGSWIGYLSCKVYDSDWEGVPYWCLVGYPGDVAGGERPSFETLAIDDDDSDGNALELEHFGASSEGDSGGPLIGWWPDTYSPDAPPWPFVIGTEVGAEIISGGFLGIGDETNNIAAGGQAMVDLVNWARENWPEHFGE